MKLTSMLMFWAVMITAMVRFAPAAEFATLAENGKSDYVVVLPNNPSAVQTTAANQLVKYIAEITGVTLPVSSEADAKLTADSAAILIGPSPITDALLRENSADYAYDTIRLKTLGRRGIILSGHPVRGPLYAAFELLGKFGCRWWTATDATIPKCDRLVVEKIDVRYAPKLESRESFYTGFIGDGHSEFAAKMRCNGNSNIIADDWGGHQVFQHFVHSFYPLIAPEKYFLDHPDWFPEIEGVRKVGRPDWVKPGGDYHDFIAKLSPEQIHAAGTQLCLTSEGLFEEMLKNALHDLANNPKATIISISQNDWYGYCTCEKCKAIDDEEGSPAGSLLRFVNRMAEEIEKVHPHVYVETLAYQYTRKPPKITHARKNVIVRLCSIECSFVQPLGTGPQNESFKDDMVGWSKMADNIFIWDYMTDFALYLLPFPNYRVWKENINFFIDHNTIGLFEQGDYQMPTGDFVQMRGWVVARLLWDPSLDQRKLMEEFIAGYYAPELVPVYMAYFDTLSDACEQSGIHLGIFKRTTNDWFDLVSLNRATELQNEAGDIAAKLAAADPARYGNLPTMVARERIPLDLTWVMNYRPFLLESKLTQRPFLGPADPLVAAKELFDRMTQNRIVTHSEWATPDDFNIFKQNIIDSFDPEVMSSSVPEFLRDIPLSRWYDVQENELTLSRPNLWTFLERDEKASNKRGVRIPTMQSQRAVVGHVSRLFELFKSMLGENTPVPKVHIYLWLRADSPSNEGDVMTLGVFDRESKTNILERTVSLAEVAGSEYKIIDLGEIQPSPKQDFWASPVIRDDDTHVWLDRVILVWE